MLSHLRNVEKSNVNTLGRLFNCAVVVHQCHSTVIVKLFGEIFLSKRCLSIARSFWKADVARILRACLHSHLDNEIRQITLIITKDFYLYTPWKLHLRNAKKNIPTAHPHPTRRSNTPNRGNVSNCRARRC